MTFIQDFLTMLKGFFFFQRQFYQPDGSQQQLSQHQHEIQATATTAGREREVEFSGSAVPLLTFVFNLVLSPFNEIQ